MEDRNTKPKITDAPWDSGVSLNNPTSDVNPESYCRTCATVNDYLIPIFKGEGLSHQLKMKIEKYLPVQISEMDKLPIQLCYQCASTLISWDTFITGCQDAERKLKELLSLQTLTPELKDEKILQLDDISMRLSDNTDSDDEPLSTKTGQNKLKPLAGDEQKLLADEMDSKQSQHHQSTKRNGKQMFTCKTCTATFTRRFNLERHLSLHSNETYICYICGKQYRGRNVLDNHIVTVHRKVNNPDWICKICDKGHSSKIAYEDHVRTHTGERPFICEVCGKASKTRSSLAAHRKIHVGIKSYKCSLCHYTCRLKSTFMDHCQRHEGIKNVICNVCNKSFVNNYDLSKHKKTHSDVRSYACSYCDMTFVMKRYLRVHTWTHKSNSDGQKNNVTQ